MNSQNVQFNRGAVNAVECVKRGWDVVKPTYAIFVLIGLAIVVLGCIPIVSWFLIGPLLVGVYAALLKQYRGQKAEFGMLFSGFGKFFPAFVMGLLLLLPGILLNTYSMVVRLAQLLAILDPNEFSAGAATLFVLLGYLVKVVAIISSIIFGITFTFGLPLVADKDLPLMDTIKLSAKAGWANFGGLFLLFLLIGLLLIGGIIALCIGIFFVLPIVYGALTVAYRQVFPDEAAGGQYFGQPAPYQE